MGLNLSSLTGTQPLILGLAVVGSSTAAVITGHISGTDFLGVLAGLGVIGGSVTTAHVVGTQVNQAATTSALPSPPPTGPTSGVV